MQSSWSRAIFTTTKFTGLERRDIAHDNFSRKSIGVSSDDDDDDSVDKQTSKDVIAVQRQNIKVRTVRTDRTEGGLAQTESSILDEDPVEGIVPL